jgi:CBS domain-containing protein
VTDRDLVVRAIASRQDPKSTRLESVCSRDMTVLKSTETTDEAVKLMREKAIRRLPVIDGAGVVGVVSLGDLAVQLDQCSALGQISPARRIINMAS